MGEKAMCVTLSHTSWADMDVGSDWEEAAAAEDMVKTSLSSICSTSARLHGKGLVCVPCVSCLPFQLLPLPAATLEHAHECIFGPPKVAPDLGKQEQK